MPPVEDGAFAVWLARQAGDLLLALRDELGFDDPAGLRAAGDKRSHDLLMTELARLASRRRGAVRGGRRRPRPAHRQPAVDHRPARRHPRVRRAGPRRLGGARGAVAAHRRRRRARRGGRRPARRSSACSAASRPRRTRRCRRRWPRAARSGSRPAAPGRRRSWPRVAEQVGAELVPMGSAGAKIAAVVTGEVDAYIHGGGQYEWDSAAPVAVAARGGPAHLAHRRLPADLQPVGREPARSARLPP